jgi:hypothetical protein
MAASNIRVAAFLALAALAVSACGQAATPTPSPTPSPSPSPIAPPELAVDAADGTITGPDSLAAGWIKLSAKNLKPPANCGFFVRLNDNVTPSAFADAVKAGPTPQVQAMVSFEGNIPLAPPTEIYLRARPGQHAFVCFVPTVGGPPAAKLKMVTVTNATDRPAAEPRSEITITERDFVFDFPSEIKAGTRIVRVLNAGLQPHEMLIVKLAAGKTIADLIALLSAPRVPGQPPPAPPYEIVGGLGPVAAGGAAIITLDLKPGTYHALCFIPDPSSQKPHVALGMVQEITVR